MLRIYRVARRLYLWHVPLLPWLPYVLNRLVFSVVLPPTAVVGRNVIFGYSGLAIVIHKRARIGNDVVISPNVTIGGRSGHQDVPVIGDAVARILGPVKIGNEARIGANAVVSADVPAGGVAVGIPARVVRINPLKGAP